MIRSPPSLQSLCSQSVIESQGLVDVLDPYEDDWSVDTPRNGRLTDDEQMYFVNLAASGKVSLTKCKAALRMMLYRRPCDLDLIQMRKRPLLQDLSDLSLRQLWADTIILDWERFVPTQLECNIGWEQRVMTWEIYNNLYDGCAHKWLFKILERERLTLVKKDEDRALLAQEANDLKDWKKTVGREWLQDMRSLINYAFVLFL